MATKRVWSWQIILEEEGSEIHWIPVNCSTEHTWTSSLDSLRLDCIPESIRLCLELCEIPVDTRSDTSQIMYQNCIACPPSLHRGTQAKIDEFISGEFENDIRSGRQSLGSIYPLNTWKISRSLCRTSLSSIELRSTRSWVTGLLNQHAHASKKWNTANAWSYCWAWRSVLINTSSSCAMMKP